MKSSHAPVMKKDQRLRLEGEVDTRIQALFRRCPTLWVFTLLDLSDPDGDELSSSDECPIEVAEVGFSGSLTLEEMDRIQGIIDSTISDVLLDQPRAFGLLCGRTFARVLQ